MKQMSDLKTMETLVTILFYIFCLIPSITALWFLISEWGLDDPFNRYGFGLLLMAIAVCVYMMIETLTSEI